MADKENGPFSANAPAPDAPAPDAPVIDAAPADTPATEATDAAPTAPKPKKKAQIKKEKADARNAERRQKPIDTPINKIVAVNPAKKVGGAGLVGRIRTDNSHKKKGKVEILDSNGDDKWFSPGLLVEIEQKEKDAFEKEEKKPKGKPYYLGGDDDASESDGGEYLEKPPVAKEAEIETLGTTSLRELHKYVDGPRDARLREQKARDSAALLADVSEAKADERAALVKSLSKTLKDAWAKYEKHRAEHPELYPEEEAEQAPKDYSDVNIDHVDVADWAKKRWKGWIQKCVAEDADLSSVEAMYSNDIQKSDFLKALRNARGESLEQQQSPRLAGEEAPPLPTISQPATSLVYSTSTESHPILRQMLADAPRLRDVGTLVPTTGLAGCARRGGFASGVGLGAALRLVGVPGPGFVNRFDNFAVDQSDPAEAIAQGLRIDLLSCFVLPEWAELEQLLVYESKLALGALPDSATEKQMAQAVFEAYHEVVEKFEHETVWKSTFKAIDMMRDSRVDGVASMESRRWCRVVGVASTVSCLRRRVLGVATMAWPSGPTHRYEKLVAIRGDADALRARFVERAQLLADFNLASCQKGGYAYADSDPALLNLGEARKAVARSNLSAIVRGPSGAERAENNLYAQYSKERSKAGHFDFAHLVGDFSNFSFQDFEDEA